MQSIRKVLSALVANLFLLLTPGSLMATVPVSTGFEGPGSTVFVIIHHEDASPIGHITSKCERDLIALTYIFKKLQSEQKLDPDFPRLVIVATKYYTLNSRFETAPAELLFTNAANLICSNPDLPQFEPRNLGPAYMIRIATGLLNFSDLTKLILHLSELDNKTPKIKISSEEELSVAVTNADYERFMNLEVKDQQTGVESGGYRVSAIWRSQVKQYMIIDEAGQKVASLEPVPFYTSKPVWPPAGLSKQQGSIIAYASEKQAYVYDILNNRYHVKLFGEDTISNIEQQVSNSVSNQIQLVQFAMCVKTGKVIVMPFGVMGQIDNVFALNLESGEWFLELTGDFISDQVWNNRNNGDWLDFIPATPERRIRNIDIVWQAWTAGQNFLSTANDENKLPWSWLLFLIIPLLLVVYFCIYRRKKHCCYR